MKKITFPLLLVLVVSSAIAQTENQDSAWIKDNYTKQELNITMRDGIKLFTTVYIPNEKREKHPILMMRTPYSCAPYVKEVSPRLWTVSVGYSAIEN